MKQPWASASADDIIRDMADLVAKFRNHQPRYDAEVMFRACVNVLRFHRAEFEAECAKEGRDIREVFRMLCVDFDMAERACSMLAGDKTAEPR